MASALGFDVTSVLTTFALSLLFFYVIFKKFRERNFPPGPTGLPLLGYAPFLGKTPHKVLRTLSKTYGDVFSFTVGPLLNICVNDYHLAKELLCHPLTLARPPKAFDFMMGKGGMGGLNGEEWQEQRRFAFFAMRNLGLGKGPWETMIQISSEDFVAEIKSWNGKPMCIEGPLSYSQANNGISLLVGRPFDKEKDADTLDLIQRSTRALMEFFSSVGVNICLPWMSKIMETFHLAGYHKFIKLLRSFENIFRKEVDARMKSPESLTKDDFIGIYFKEMAKKEKEGKPHYFTVENLLGNLLMLFLAGNDSTMAGVSWLLLLMCKHQDVQKKIHDEIDAAVGRDGVVYYEVKKKLPYTMAVLHEMTRFISINPIFPPRYVLETFKFNGHTIPQGSHVVVNIWSIMRDSRYFKDPLEFKPERFLTENQEKIIKPDGWAPFSFGKRNCPGEGVAIMSIFLYFVHIMQKFRVTMPPGIEADLEPVFGGALLPKAQKICFIER